ncbi:hypothetical protein [Streptomyces litchfieldiae]|uniref:Integral membrane protein n=1 Tax=Streptomyces litchfieldiae TaxID=3075543 RepID=A0ABU2N485_9ACTN|nr:hypothetical protein [Streptomyces sp. DSM 44938]MDT0347544.1 hypothetical protein [Streptomyces sp. DSM 44938]
MSTDSTPPDNTTPTPTDTATTPPASRMRRWWEQTLDWTGDRIEDVLDAYAEGWSGTATWIRALAYTAGTAAGLAALWGVFRFFAWVAGWSIPNAPDVPDVPDVPRDTGLVATITQPVHTYLEAHTIGLPLEADTAYTTWYLIGAGALLLGMATGSVGARLTWTAWGAATVAMVWQATPDPGRPVAVGLAVLAWTAASVLALQGLNLRPVTHHHTHITTQPRIDIPQPRVERIDINGRQIHPTD